MILAQFSLAINYLTSIVASTLLNPASGSVKDGKLAFPDTEGTHHPEGTFSIGKNTHK